MTEKHQIYSYISKEIEVFYDIVPRFYYKEDACVNVFDERCPPQVVVCTAVLTCAVPISKCSCVSPKWISFSDASA